jgi:hypothetical protein
MIETSTYPNGNTIEDIRRARDKMWRKASSNDEDGPSNANGDTPSNGSSDITNPT